MPVLGDGDVVTVIAASVVEWPTASTEPDSARLPAVSITCASNVAFVMLSTGRDAGPKPNLRNEFTTARLFAATVGVTATDVVVFEA